MKHIKLWLGCLLLISLFSCDLEDDGISYHFVPLQITSADLPESFDLNGIYEVSVTYLKPNSCVFFEGFDIRREDTTTRNVVAIGSELEDRECAQVIEEETATFNFQVLYTEPYLFRFWTGEDENGVSEYFEITVPVNP